MKGAVLHRVGILELFFFWSKMGQGFKLSVAALYPNMAQVPPLRGVVTHHMPLLELLCDYF